MTHGTTYPDVALLIDGDWITDRAPCHEVVNPADDAVLGPVPGATAEDMDRALAAAKRGFETWRKVPPQERAALLKRVAVLMRERAAEIAPAITLEHGKPLADAEAEVARSSSFLDWDAEQLLRSYGRIVPTPHPNYQFVTREPIGPVAAFTPWNVPVSAAGRKLAGSIAAGCSVIIKPASQTPASTCLLAKCFIDAGLPDGVLQVIHGRSSEVSRHLILSPVIRMVTLTGSVGVGKELTKLAAEGVKPVLMELGGHAPVLIGPDVNPETVAALSVGGKFRMAGQLCVTPSRFLIHSKVYDDFVGAFAEKAGKLKVGDGFTEGAEVGPLVNHSRIDVMQTLVSDAVGKGATVLTGGERVGNTGCFFSPTVLGDVPRDARIMHEEPFGPVAPCARVSDMDEALSIANDIELGLAGYVFTNDVEVADRLSNGLECGSVAINQYTSPGPDAPFGGHKESGIGTEGGMETLDAYTVSKTISQRRVNV